MAEDLGEKTEDPTQRKRQESRRKGQVPRSQDLSAGVILGAAAIMLFALGGHLMSTLGLLMRSALDPDLFGGDVTEDALGPALTRAGFETLKLMGPMLAIMAVVALAEQRAQGGLVFSSEAMNPKLDRLSPVKGVQRTFSRRNLVKGFVNIIKVSALGALVCVVVMMSFERIVALPALPMGAALLETARIVVELALWSLLLLLFIGVIDRMYQNWQHTQDIKMTKHEVKEERKSSDGDVDVKARRMRLAREIARQRVRSDVPRADVVVTNPTHYAVALRYDEEEMGAPKVLALLR